MPTADKVAQLIHGDITDFMNITTGAFNSTGLDEMLKYKAGSIYIGQPAPADMLRSGVEYVQKHLVEETELGIPAFIQTEGIHGALVINGTIFPYPIAMAGSFNPDLIHEVAEVVAHEAALFGASQVFAPVIDLARELRWGRVEENYGEDPYLTGEMGHAFVTGLQNIMYLPWSSTLPALVRQWVASILPLSRVENEI
ncbi:hypothetical protein TRVA0_015S00276 [Trichomonascus vanleenenianus]|uniref:uncharacterized protein n=1 Tax=Trichomonascus vanleenenianus TaxID=2268995 RepID=UPI003EC9EF78